METNTIKNPIPKIIVQFPIIGKQLLADHGYLLYSAISQLKPELHNLPDDEKWLGIELINGVPFDKGIIALPVRGANLRLRIPADKFGEVMNLSGKQLDIDGNKIRLGIANARPIQPASALYARIVTFKNSLSVEKFLETANRDLAEKLQIKAKLEIPKENRSRHRRIITIKGKKVVGFSLIARDLTDEDSLKLQSEGLGGRRTMGCGLFNPIRKPADSARGNDEI
ncbi:MAG: type I-MYXAN CRISPR-associated protein Cas6/Cmx6 [Pyrinomonadaceae bacterium]|nr:type I-MYXAN CRISPR-associated protein Cas6/Cmx6 [Pyrinomonadaceae bacterium]